MNTTELTPVNGRKSFGGKAKMKKDGEITYLESYGTTVAQYNHSNNKMTVLGYFCATTLTHINAFLAYFGFDTCTKRQLEEFYLNN